MNERQRESAAKFLYDVAKGITLLAVINPIVVGQVRWPVIAIGFTGTLTFSCGPIGWKVIYDAHSL